MPHAGPQWFDPDNAETTAAALLQRSLLNAEDPTASLLITKPLKPEEGGVKHAGGPFFGKDSAQYPDFLLAAEAAAACLSR